MGSKSVAMRQLEAERERERATRLHTALNGPVPSWEMVREAIEEAEEAIAYARVLATRRLDDNGMKEARKLGRQVAKVAKDAFGGSQVYVIKRKGARSVKIGVTTRLRERMRALQNASGGELELLLAFPGERADEQRLHERFAAYRKRGEWFEYSPAIARWVKETTIAGAKHG